MQVYILRQDKVWMFEISLLINLMWSINGLQLAKMNKYIPYMSPP